MARRSSALARAIRTSASAWSACSRAPTLSPTSMSAISIETISYAVLESSPLLRTCASDQHRVGEDFFVSRTGSDGRYNSFSHTSDHCFFGRSANQLTQIRTYSDAGSSFQLNSITSDSVQCCAPVACRVRAVDDFCLDARLNRLPKRYALRGQLRLRYSSRVRILAF